MYEELVKRLRERCVFLFPHHGESQSYDADLMHEAADAIDEMSREIDIDNAAMTAMDAAMPSWIPVTERLPEDFQKVLVFWREHSEPMIDTAFWQKDAKRFDGEHWVRMEDKVTHWMPLPTAPEPKEET